MLYIKNKKEAVKRSYDHLHTGDHITTKAKARRKSGRTTLGGRPKK